MEIKPLTYSLGLGSSRVSFTNNVLSWHFSASLILRNVQLVSLLGPQNWVIGAWVWVPVSDEDGVALLTQQRNFFLCFIVHYIYGTNHIDEILLGKVIEYIGARMHSYDSWYMCIWPDCNAYSFYGYFFCYWLVYGHLMKLHLQSKVKNWSYCV